MEAILQTVYFLILSKRVYLCTFITTGGYMCEIMYLADCLHIHFMQYSAASNGNLPKVVAALDEGVDNSKGRRGLVVRPIIL